MLEAKLKSSDTKRRILGATFLFAVLMASLTVIVPPSCAAITGFSYFKEFTVGRVFGAGTDYQVKLVVHYGSGTDSGNVVYLDGNCRSDFGDVRFVDSDNTTFLSYWMENVYTGGNAIFWVKIKDDLSSASSTNYIYYGNSGYSSVSDGAATFILFDDFNGASLDSTLWEPYGGIGTEYVANLSLSDGLIHIWGPNGQPSGILSKAGFLYNVRVHSLAYTAERPVEGMVGFQDKANQNHALVGSLLSYWPYYISSNRFSGESSNVYNTYNEGYYIIDDKFHVFDEVMLNSSCTFSFVDEILIVNNDRVPIAPLNASLTIWSDGEVIADYLAVTKYVDPEPQVDFQPETEPPPSEVPASEVPLAGWVVNSVLTDASHALSSTESSLLLELDATSTESMVVIYSHNVPSSDLGVYDYLEVSATGTDNAMVFLRFFLDDGSGFDVVYYDSVATLNAVSFDLSSYADRTMIAAYIALISSDGQAASIEITQIALLTGEFQYALSVATIGSGLVVKSPDQVLYASGTVVTLTAIPAAGWSFSGWSGDLTGSASPASLTVTDDMVVTATFVQIIHTITASAGSGGFIAPSGTVTVAYGFTQSFTIEPDVGYEIFDVLVDGLSVGAVSSYEFTNVIANHIITASFTQGSYTITASVEGIGGMIDPYGALTVNGGEDKTFTLTPDAGYHILNVMVDGVYMGPQVSFTFHIIDSDHTITAIFAENEYSLTMIIVGPGRVSINPNKISYSFGDIVEITATPNNKKFMFDHWEGDLTGYTNPETITMDSNKTVYVYFTKK